MELCRQEGNQNESETFISRLTIFNKKNETPPGSGGGGGGGIIGAEEEEEYTKLWYNTTKLLLNNNDPSHLCTCLTTIRILSRDKSRVSSVVDEVTIATLLYLGGLQELLETTEGASVCTVGDASEDASCVVAAERTAGSADVNSAQSAVTVKESLPAPVNYQVAGEACKCLSNLVFQSPRVQALCSTPSCLQALLLRLTAPRAAGSAAAGDGTTGAVSKKSEEVNSAATRGLATCEKTGGETHDSEGQPHHVTLGYVKLLFLVTALSPQTRSEVAASPHTLTALLPLLSCHPLSAASSVPSQPTMQRHDVERIVEVLKLLYNLCVVRVSNDCSNGLESSAAKQRNCDEQQPNKTKSEANDKTGKEEVNGGVGDRSSTGGSAEDKNKECMLSLVGRVRELLLATAHTHEHTQLMHSHCINLLVAVAPAHYAALTPPASGAGGGWWGGTRKPAPVHDGRDMSAVVAILAFLHARLNTSEVQSSERLTPVLSLLVAACGAERGLRKFVRQRVLPPLKTAATRPEEGTSLRSRLVRLMTSPLMDLKHLAATLLFVLCKHNVERLIKYSGYGNCAGLLASLGLLAGAAGGGNQPPSDDSSEDSDTEDYTKIRHMVNPVTGCYEEERPNPMDEMSEEQREYEAVKLVNVIDKMIRDGTIKPCSVGPDGKPQPLEHVLQLQEQRGAAATAKDTAASDEDDSD